QHHRARAVTLIPQQEGLGRRFQWATGGERIARKHGGPVDAPVAGAKVRQRKPVAGGLGGRLSPADLAQIPVVELMTVEKAQQFAPGAEANGSTKPLEGDPPPGLAAGPVVDLL